MKALLNFFPVFKFKKWLANVKIFFILYTRALLINDSILKGMKNQERHNDIPTVRTGY
jgi:hypothetical protein